MIRELKIIATLQNCYHTHCIWGISAECIHAYPECASVTGFNDPCLWYRFWDPSDEQIIIIGFHGRCSMNCLKFPGWLCVMMRRSFAAQSRRFATLLYVGMWHLQSVLSGSWNATHTHTPRKVNQFIEHRPWKLNKDHQLLLFA